MLLRLTAVTLFVAIGALRSAAQDTLATVARTMYGDVALIVQVRPNQVRLAVDNGTHNLFLSFVGSDVRRWSDSTTRILARKRRRGDATAWRSAMFEPGMRSGTASLTLRPDSSGTSYTLFFADDSLRSVRGTVRAADAAAFTRILRNASHMALGGRSLPKGRPKQAPKS
jgi:hypothetical protein